ncbi:hypothetical protein CEK63_03950, partial [Xanthomonas sontii]
MHRHKRKRKHDANRPPRCQYAVLSARCSAISGSSWQYRRNIHRWHWRRKWLPQSPRSDRRA